MNIPVEALLNKMMAEIKAAEESRNHPEGARHVREHIKIVQSLCEVILDSQPDRNAQTGKASVSIPSYSKSQMIVSTQQLPQTPIQEEDANGDSLLDF